MLTVNNVTECKKLHKIRRSYLQLQMQHGLHVWDFLADFHLVHHHQVNKKQIALNKAEIEQH